jgi:blue copper oxidase
MDSINRRRRNLIGGVAALAGLPLAINWHKTSIAQSLPALPAQGASPGAAPAIPAPADVCANGSTFTNALALPGSQGWMGLLDLRSADTLTAVAVPSGAGALAYEVSRGGHVWRNPVLTVDQGNDVKVGFVNRIDEATIVHWHGLAIDSHNDGNGAVVAEPGARFDYRFAVSNRAGTYWYHPHPHGLTAGQAQRGLFGALIVSDAEEKALSRALDVRLGVTDIPLMLHDRRAATSNDYLPSPADVIHGYVGDEVTVNGTPRPYLDVASRGYRLRVINAANARTFRVAFRAADGALLPFTLLGTDGGLLARPLPLREVFIASAERVDLWIDFRERVLGDSIVMESLAFDPMHIEMPKPAPDATTAAPASAATGDSGVEHHHGGGAAGDGSATIAEGARLSLLQFRIRSKGTRSPGPPAALSALAEAAPGASERPLRLSFAKGRWRINDRVFEMDVAPPIVVARNTTETWLFRNYFTSMPHAMHLHGFSMRVLARETSPDFIGALAVDAQGRLPTDLGVKDTVLVWPGESVRVAIDFRCDFPGDQVYLVHCHNLEHEDGGMMLRVKVT